MRRIAIWAAKGGTGKTTATLNLAAVLAQRGKRVLLADLDPQATATRGLRVEPEAGLLDLLLDQGDLGERIVQVPDVQNLYLLPGSPYAASAERQHAGEAGAERLLALALGRLRRYDLVLLDCPPGVGILVVSALAAATEHVAPVDPAPFAVAGLSYPLAVADTVRQRLNPKLARTRVLLSRVARTRAARETVAGLRQRLGDRVLATEIPERAVVVEATAAKQPVVSYAPDHPVAEAFVALARELEKR